MDEYLEFIEYIKSTETLIKFTIRPESEPMLATAKKELHELPPKFIVNLLGNYGYALLEDLHKEGFVGSLNVQEDMSLRMQPGKKVKLFLGASSGFILFKARQQGIPSSQFLNLLLQRKGQTFIDLLKPKSEVNASA